MNRLYSKKLVMQSMLRRPQHKGLKGRLHPNHIDRLIKITQKPEQLQYKLHNVTVNTTLPHNAPLLPLQPLPFHIDRTNSGNLPVYLTYRNQHNLKRTTIRKLSGNIEQFTNELKKVVSNHEINIKTGRIQIYGVHKQSVQTWLLKLGL